jgi:hypothetical protein
MVLADTTLSIAGPPSLVDEEAAFARLSEAQAQSALAAQREAFEDRKGALLWAVRASDGTKLAKRRLDSTPVWDGMAAAGGRIYVSTTDEKVLCMAGGN